MQILLIHNIMWSHYKATVFSELHRQASAAGLDVMVLQTALTASGQKALSQVDKSIHKYQYELLFESSFEETTLMERYRAYVDRIQRFGPKVVVLPGYADKAIWLLTVYLRYNGIPFIQSCDSTYSDHKRVWYKESIKRILLSPAELVFCYGANQQSYLEYLSIPREKIWKRLQATDNHRILAEFNKLYTSNAQVNYSSIKFLFVGRLAPEKNLQLLLHAFAMLPENSTLTLVGEGPERLNIEDLAISLGISGRVFFEGSTNWTGVVKYYGQSHVFVLPSLSETWGLVINEAMLCRLPVVVSSNCGASGDLVLEGVNGYTFDPYDVNELRDKLNKFIESPALITEMGNVSREIIEEYTPEKAAAQMLAGLQKVMAEID